VNEVAMSGSLNKQYRTAFITGASSGLGEAFTRMLLEEGVKVWGTSRDSAKLQALRDQYPQLFSVVCLELNQAEEAVNQFRKAEKEAGGFDLVIQNAGYGLFGNFELIPSETWNTQLSSMLGTTLALSHAAWTSMRSTNQGCLVHISSLAVDFPLPFMSGYNVVKAGVSALSESLMTEARGTKLPFMSGYNVVKAGISALSESLMTEARGTNLVVIDFRPGDFKTAFNERAHKVDKLESDKRLKQAWLKLEENLNTSPKPTQAARDLKKALKAGKSGIVISGGFLQARLAPLAAHLLPKKLLRKITALYFN